MSQLTLIPEHSTAPEPNGILRAAARVAAGRRPAEMFEVIAEQAMASGAARGSTIHRDAIRLMRPVIHSAAWHLQPERTPAEVCDALRKAADR